MTARLLRWTLDPFKISHEDAVLPWVSLHSDYASDLCANCRYLDLQFFFTQLMTGIKDLRYKDVLYSRVDSIGIEFSTIEGLRRKRKECAFCKLVWHALQTQADMSEVNDYHDGRPVNCYLSNSVECLYGPTSHIPDNGEPYRLVIEVVTDLWFDNEIPTRHEQGLVYITCNDFELGMARVLQPKVDTEWVKQMLSLCTSSHGAHPDEACPAHLEVEHVMTRFIDVKEMRIVQRSTNLTQYAILSYVWGTAESIVLSTTNMSILAQRQGLKGFWDHMPVTIRDAMTLCQDLSIRHLWVDALCIVQDSAEKMHQISRMGDIYGNAHVTIAAAAGLDANTGIAGVSPRFLTPYTSAVGNFRLVNLCRPTVDSSIWNTRAWTYQERLLSHKLFVFTEQDAWFFCRHGTSRESSRLGIHEHAHLISCTEPSQGDYTLDSTDIIDFDVYVRTLAEFSSRKLTHSDDVINAVSGLIAVIAKSFTNADFLYGMPAHLLDMALLWRSTQPLQRRKGWPSWSWAGWIGSVTYADLMHFGDRTKTCLELPEDRSVKCPTESNETSKWRRHYSEEDGSIYYTHSQQDQRHWHSRPSPLSSFYLIDTHRPEGILQFRTKVADLFVSTSLSNRLRNAYSYYKGTKSQLSIKSLNISPLKVFDDAGVHIGIIFLDSDPTSSTHPILDRKHRIICLSRTTYSFGDLDPAWDEDSKSYAGEPGAPAINPQDIEESSGFLHSDSGGKGSQGEKAERVNDEWFDFTVYEFNICWALYNVMMVSEKKERLGIGKVHAHVFDKVGSVELVCLR